MKIYNYQLISLEQVKFLTSHPQVISPIATLRDWTHDVLSKSHLLISLLANTLTWGNMSFSLEGRIQFNLANICWEYKNKMQGNWPETCTKCPRPLHSNFSPVLLHFKSIQYIKAWVCEIEQASLQKTFTITCLWLMSFPRTFKIINGQKSYLHIGNMPVM